MKKSLKFNELEKSLKMFDVIFRSSDDEKTKAKDLQYNAYYTFNYAAERQVEKFL